MKKQTQPLNQSQQHWPVGSPLSRFSVFVGIAVFALAFSAHADLTSQDPGTKSLVDVLNESRATLSESPFADRYLRLSLEKVSSEKPKSINIASGFPLTSSQDPTGGFGDVAANLIGALELKKRNPQIEINFFVTDIADENREAVRSTSEIIRTMAPELDPSKGLQRQVFKGLNVYFLRTSGEDYVRQGSDSFRDLPKADLGLQLSANNDGARALLLATSRLSMDFKEYMDPTQIEKDRHRAVGSRRDRNQLPIRSHNAGPFQDGSYVTSPISAREQASQKLALEHWIAQKLNLPSFSLSGTELALAYSGRDQSILNYTNAVIEEAKANPSKKYVYLMRDLGRVYEANRIPENLKILPMKGFPYAVFEAALIHASLPPLVTGDNSFSLALSANRPDRFFIYDTYEWKTKFTADFTAKLLRLPSLQHLSEDKKAVANAVMSFNVWTQNPVELLRHFFQDRDLQKSLSSTVSDLNKRSDIYDSILKIVALEHQLEIEARNGLVDAETFEILKSAKLRTKNEQEWINRVLDQVSKVNRPRTQAQLIAVAAKFGAFSATGTGARTENGLIHLLQGLPAEAKAMVFAWATIDLDGPLARNVLKSEFALDFEKFAKAHVAEAELQAFTRRINEVRQQIGLKSNSGLIEKRSGGFGAIMCKILFRK